MRFTDSGDTDHFLKLITLQVNPKVAGTEKIAETVTEEIDTQSNH